MRSHSYDRCCPQDLADHVGRSINSRHHYIRKPLVERSVVPEARFAATDAAVARSDRKRNTVVPFHRRAGVVGRWPPAPHLVEAPALPRSFVIPRLHELPCVEKRSPVALVVNSLPI